MNFHDNSKNKNRKIVFSFVYAHCTSFMRVGSKLRGVVCLSLVGTEPVNLNTFEIKKCRKKLFSNLFNFGGGLLPTKKHPEAEYFLNIGGP